MFWRQEYSKLPSKQDGCHHSWQTDEGKYTYSIRHLYGLEGSRTNYRGHSCTTLQVNLWIVTFFHPISLFTDKVLCHCLVHTSLKSFSCQRIVVSGTLGNINYRTVDVRLLKLWYSRFCGVNLFALVLSWQRDIQKLSCPSVHFLWRHNDHLMLFGFHWGCAWSEVQISGLEWQTFF